MVRINPGSFFPEHEFAQLDRNAVEQLVLGDERVEHLGGQDHEARDVDGEGILAGRR